MKQKARIVLGFTLLAALMALMVFLNINTGSVHMSVGQIVDILFGANPGSIESNVIWKIRMPRMLGCAVLGGALAIAGYLLQTFFRNPIAGPFVLGISSGARLFVGFFMLLSLPILGQINSPYTIFAAAFVGALFAMGVALLVAGRVKSVSMLLVVGTMIGYLCSAGTDFMITFAENSQLRNFTMWSMGSFAAMTWNTVKASAVIAIPASAAVLLLIKPLKAYLLGEEYASSAGMNVKAFRRILVIISSVLSACVTAFAGPISFVGIAIPHIARMLFHTSEPRTLIPAVFLTGSVFCMFCDLIARTVFAPTELAISTVTSVFGAPVVIWLMVRRRKNL